MQLPIMAAPDEFLVFAKYLNTKVSGSSLDDARAAVGNKIVDPRKINAYISWGMLLREGEKLKLSDRGKRLIKAESEEDIKVIYQEVVRSIDAYMGVVEWIVYTLKALAVTNVEVAEHWHDNKKYEMSNENDNTLKDRAVCFFKVCEAAGLGKLYIGRRGASTRLELNMDAIISFESSSSMLKEEKTVNSDIVTEKSETIDMDLGRGIIPLTIPFIDGRVAVLNMPKNASKDDAQYVFDMLKLILSRQYGLE